VTSVIHKSIVVKNTIGLYLHILQGHVKMNNTHTECVAFFTATIITQTGKTLRYMWISESQRPTELQCPAPLQPDFGPYSEPRLSIQCRFNVNLRSTLLSNRYHIFGYINYNFLFLLTSLSPLHYKPHLLYSTRCNHPTHIWRICNHEDPQIAAYHFTDIWNDTKYI
jgi:hypothetical protein